jgi:hypothetical protein
MISHDEARRGAVGRGVERRDPTMSPKCAATSGRRSREYPPFLFRLSYS